MAVDFWNNPIVVSAFRVKYRRGGLFGFVSLYLCLLVGGAGWLWLADNCFAGSWPETFFVALVGVQCLLLGLGASTAAGQSIRRELDQHTFDFQRVATLPPRDIVLGKILGEPALAYLCAIASFPLAVLCWLAGGVTLSVLLLAYLNVATTLFLLGVLGLRGQLRLHGTQTGTVWFILAMLWAGAQFFLLLFFKAAAAALGALATPWILPLVGSLLPLPALYGMTVGDPWIAVSVFGLPIPFLVFTPVTQVVVALFYFRSMVRQLVRPLDPSFGKRLAWVALIVVDVLTAGVLVGIDFDDMSPGRRVAAFCLVHLLASLALILGATASRAGIHSSIWRRRGGPADFRERWLAERSDNGFLTLTFAALGIVALFAALVMPLLFQYGWEVLADEVEVLVAAPLIVMVLTFGVGAIVQRFCLVEEGGAGLAVFGLALMVAVPHVLGQALELPAVLALSPSAWYASWWWSEPLPLGLLPPLLALYAVVGVACRLDIRRRLRRIAAEVREKLQTMGVEPANGPVLDAKRSA
jgi:hypothetical protein